MLLSRETLTLIWRLMVISAILLTGAMFFFDFYTALAQGVVFVVLLWVVRKVMARALVKQWGARYMERRDEFVRQFREDPEMAARMAHGEWHPSDPQTKHQEAKQ